MFVESPLSASSWNKIGIVSIFCKNLVVIRTPVRPSRACHNITSVHRIRADLKDRKIEYQLRSDLYNQELNISYKYF